MTIILKEGEYYETKEIQIDVSKLEKEKLDLEKKISEIPLPKTKPDEETLTLWNNLLPKAEPLEERLSKINEELNKIYSVK